MKFISAAIVLLASVAVVTSMPVYGSDDSTSVDNSYDSSTTDDSYPSTTTTYSSESTYSPSYNESDKSYCEGFKITTPSDSQQNISLAEGSQYELVFDWGSSNIGEVEYVDLVMSKNQATVDEWATGPWISSNPRTGLHDVHVHGDENSYYQFLVYAATKDTHYHCTYLSVEFKITPKTDNSKSDNHSSSQYHEGDNYSPDNHDGEDDYSSSSDYNQPTPTVEDWSTASDDEPFSTYSP